MSKKNEEKLILGLSPGFIFVAVALVLFIAGIVLFHKFNDYQDKTRTSTEYQKITLPTQLHLLDKEWHSYSVDVPSYWEYKYSFVGSSETAQKAFEIKLKNSGLHEQEYSCGNGNGKPFAGPKLCVETIIYNQQIYAYAFYIGRN